MSPAPHPRMHGVSHAPGGPDPIVGLPTGGGGEAAWCRRWLATNQTVAANYTGTVNFGSIINPHPDTFGTGGATGYGIQILQDGLYAATYRIFASGGSTTGIRTGLFGIDPDENGGYFKLWPKLAVSNQVFSDTVVFRSGPDYGDAPPEIWMEISNPNEAITTTVFQFGATGSYLEIVQLAGATAGLAPAGLPFKFYAGTETGDVSDLAWVGHLGTRFTVRELGVVCTGIQVRRSDTTALDVRLWTSAGAQLAQATLASGAAGWYEVTFTTPVALTKGQAYIASSHGPSTRNRLATGVWPKAAGGLADTASSNAGRSAANGSAATVAPLTSAGADYLCGPILQGT